MSKFNPRGPANKLPAASRRVPHVRRRHAQRGTPQHSTYLRPTTFRWLSFICPARLQALLIHLGFDERVRGSHHLFNKPGVVEIINIQTVVATPNQIR